MSNKQYQWLVWWLWPRNRIFLEVARMVVTWWIMAFFAQCFPCKIHLHVMSNRPKPIIDRVSFRVQWSGYMRHDMFCWLVFSSSPFRSNLGMHIRIKSGEPGFLGFSVPKWLGGVICKPEGAAWGLVKTPPSLRARKIQESTIDRLYFISKMPKTLIN